MGLSTWEYLGYRTEDSTHEAFQGDFTRKNWSRNHPKFVIQYIQWVYVVVFQRFCIYSWTGFEDSGPRNWLISIAKRDHQLWITSGANFLDMPMSGWGLFRKERPSKMGICPKLTHMLRELQANVLTLPVLFIVIVWHKITSIQSGELPSIGNPSARTVVFFQPSTTGRAGCVRLLCAWKTFIFWRYRKGESIRLTDTIILGLDQ